MKLFQKIEDELKHRKPGWWDRVAKSIPELTDLSKTPQPRRYHAEGDVAVHTRLAVEACPSDCDPDLLWAALLHDIGKPLVTKKEGDRITAYGHAAAGAKMAERILVQFQMPSERREKIVWAIGNHTFHLSWNLAAPEQASRGHKSFVADARFSLLLELLRVDSTASFGNPGKLQAYKIYKRLRELVTD